MLFTPEMTGMLDRNRERAAGSIRAEGDDLVLRQACEAAKRHAIWLSIGSLAIVREDGRWANRTYVINRGGTIVSRYDKIHMFDVDLGKGDAWQESAAYHGGTQAEVIETPIGRLGLAICYDIRFPALFEELGNRRCDVIAIPSAFTVTTGKAHWHILQRARAIEASAFVVAAAQVGTHEDGRQTFGHSLIIDPWGEVLLDMGGQEPNVEFAIINEAVIEESRRRVPSLANRRAISSAGMP